MGGGEWLVTRVGVGLGGIGGRIEVRDGGCWRWMSLPAMQSVHAVLAVRATLARMASSGRLREQCGWQRVGRGEWVGLT